MIDEATIVSLITFHAKRIAELEILAKEVPEGHAIVCESCGARHPEPQYCGCGGTMTVAEAIRHHEFEIDILANH